MVLQKAFESLSVSTHLYGRRLVLEWAAAEDSVDDVRRRTTAHFPGGGLPISKTFLAVLLFIDHILGPGLYWIWSNLF